jgi:hypothetical protein
MRLQKSRYSIIVANSFTKLNKRSAKLARSVGSVTYKVGQSPSLILNKIREKKQYNRGHRKFPGAGFLKRCGLYFSLA